MNRSTQSRISRFGVVALAVMALCMMHAVHADSHDSTHYNNDAFEEPTNVKWQELSVPPPPAPKDADLQPFDTGPTARLQYAVDLSSIQIGTDGVVRYVLVSVSPQGARNVSFEGIHCVSDEYREFAFGQNDGSWTAATSPLWKAINSTGASNIRNILEKGYFCQETVIAGNLRDIKQRFRYNKPLSLLDH